MQGCTSRLDYSSNHVSQRASQDFTLNSPKDAPTSDLDHQKSLSNRFNVKVTKKKQPTANDFSVKRVGSNASNANDNVLKSVTSTADEFCNSDMFIQQPKMVHATLLQFNGKQLQPKKIPPPDSRQKGLEEDSGEVASRQKK